MLDAPEQIGAGGLRPGPQGEAEELPIGQAQHAHLQPGKDRLGERGLAGRVARHLTGEQHVRAVLHQRDEADLRVGTRAPAGAGPPERCLVGRLVGDIQGAAVQAYQTPSPLRRGFGRRAAVPGSFGRGISDRPHHLVMEPPHRLPAEPRAGRALIPNSVSFPRQNWPCATTRIKLQVLRLRQLQGC